VVRDVKSGIQVGCRNDEFPLGEGAAGICQRVVKVEVTQNKVRIGKKRKKPLRWYGAVRRTIRVKKVHRGDPEGVVGGSEQTFRRKIIHRLTTVTAFYFYFYYFFEIRCSLFIQNKK